jgi:glucose/arabinose dehydrogenase
VKDLIRFGTALIVAALAMPVVAAAQETKPAATPAAQEVKPTPAPSPAPAQTALKVQLVLSRYQGEKKISSVPYSLTVISAREPTRLRMSVQVPVPSTTFGGNNSPIVSYTLKDVGTNIDCWAENGQERGVYRLNMTVSDTSAIPASSLSFVKAGEGQQRGELPVFVFRNFTSTFNVLLRDGQTGQFTSATDPVSGEVLKIDATLNVLK